MLFSLEWDQWGLGHPRNLLLFESRIHLQFMLSSSQSSINGFPSRCVGSFFRGHQGRFAHSLAWPQRWWRKDCWFRQATCQWCSFWLHQCSRLFFVSHSKARFSRFCFAQRQRIVRFVIGYCQGLLCRRTPLWTSWTSYFPRLSTPSMTCRSPCFDLCQNIPPSRWTHHFTWALVAIARRFTAPKSNFLLLEHCCWESRLF